MMTIPKVIERAIAEATPETISALLDDESLVVWVDHRADDDAIVWCCEEILKTGKLEGIVVEDGVSEFEFFVRYGEKRVKVPLTYSAADRHITVCTVNEVLAPDHEVRWCIDSHGNDSLAYLPLSSAQWAELEGMYGPMVWQRFYRISAKPNLFTDALKVVDGVLVESPPTKPLPKAPIFAMVKGPDGKPMKVRVDQMFRKGRN